MKKLEKQKRKKRTAAKAVVTDETETRDVPKSTDMVENVQNIVTEMKIGSFVVVRYDNLLYPAKVLKIEKDSAKCQAKKSGSHWKWPQKPDII